MDKYIVSALKEFQNRHGGEWAEIVGAPAFSAALALAHRERLDKITVLSDAEIASHGPIILSDLRGHLQYEAALLSFHEKKEFVFQQLPPEEYPDPAAEARELSELGESREQESGVPTFASVSSAHQQLFPKPKRKRGRPPKERNKK